MANSSLLTNGLVGLEAQSEQVRRLVQELYAHEKTLNDAHQDAKRDDEHGEAVVAAYKAFLECRERLIRQLESEQVAVPWQLRVRVDDLDLTVCWRLKQRSEKAVDNKAGEKAASSDHPDTAHEDTMPRDPLVAFKAMILPSVAVLLIALITFIITSAFA
ncbi:hypothetical protein ATCC90586_006312 [Pythium insidiosum]|nr:hypothetical protein ATCC90586_006312 [Pythium insidiosum]